MKHILHFPSDVIKAFVDKAGEIMGTTDLGSSPELVAMRLASESENHAAFMSLQDGVLSGVDVAGFMEKMNSVNMNFLGFDLTAIPDWTILALIPVFAGLSALLMCYIQNKINVLQVEQSAASQWGMTIFMIAFSAYFACIVPSAIGIYWIFGNLFSIPVMYIVNIIYSPKKYIDYDALEKMKQKEKKKYSLQLTRTVRGRLLHGI
jgi:YidC/Oxa1 family membrane protein insertase